MPAKDRSAAFNRLAGSAVLQAALGDPSATPSVAVAAPAVVDVAPVEPSPPPAEAPSEPARNGRAAKATPPKAPAVVEPVEEDLGRAASRLVDLQAKRSTSSVTLYGYTVPKPAGDEATVQTTVRMPVTLRQVIDAFCREYGLTFQDFAMLSYEHLLETAERSKR